MEKKMAQLFFPLFALSTSFFITVASHAEAARFSVSSTSFIDRRNIPITYTCDGNDISPAISWGNAPAKTASFALICHDPDAPVGVWYHWVMYNIPSNISQLPEGAALPSGAALGKNSWGRAQYNGPCPPRASIHRYIFTIYALDTTLSLPSGASASELEQAMQGHILANTSILGVFGH